MTRKDAEKMVLKMHELGSVQTAHLSPIMKPSKWFDKGVEEVVVGWEVVVTIRDFEFYKELKF